MLCCWNDAQTPSDAEEPTEAYEEQTAAATQEEKDAAVSQLEELLVRLIRAPSTLGELHKVGGIFAFETLDEDGDGFISATHLRHVLTTQGNSQIPHEDVDDILRKAHFNGAYTYSEDSGSQIDGVVYKDLLA